MQRRVCVTASVWVPVVTHGDKWQWAAEGHKWMARYAPRQEDGGKCQSAEEDGH